MDVLTFALKVDNYISNATDNGTGNDKWNSTTLQKYTVPAGKRWFLLGGYVKPDASGTVDVTVYNSSNEVILYLAFHAAGTAYVTYPQLTGTKASLSALGVILDTGDYVNISMGAAQGAGALASCVVLEVDM